MPKIAPALLLAGALLSSAAGAQNMLVNPSFDSSLNGWKIDLFNPSFNQDDADGSPKSGSASVTLSGGSSTFSISLEQCVQVPAGFPGELSLKLKAKNPPANVPLAEVYYFPDSSCSQNILDSAFPSPDSIHLNTWQTLSVSLDAPSGTHSALILLTGSTAAGGGAQTLAWDDVYFGARSPAQCNPGPSTLCLDGSSTGDRRFLVVSTFATANSGGIAGSGQAISLASLGVGQGGVFWFFDHSNPEMLVKAHDACASSSYYWIFVSAGTNAGVNLYVADTHTGAVAFFHNPDLSPYPTIHDFLGLPCS
ncbi:MAG TPA: hypothetical protein VKA53_06805 [Thermoanaerobaculia bacterium]|nr:hypothetical protein [Thermoanaerobaculia bacterium]